MSSVPGPSTRASPTRFPRALLRVIATNKHEKMPCNVRLAISRRLFWIPFEHYAGAAPQSLYDFSSPNSLELTRLCGDDATSDDVADTVDPHATSNLSLVVHGRLHGRVAKFKL